MTDAREDRDRVIRLGQLLASGCVTPGERDWVRGKVRRGYCLSAVHRHLCRRMRRRFLRARRLR